ncbi:cytochrome c3 family protein [Ensifer adhaerens]|uniref:cytochrome c3 family protein n=1 Tax=Ensifer adhaerens TaxID=106592 RepID=UPI0013791E91|nr:cytochrome c3 family protein [Ensifer adhaerens]
MACAGLLLVAWIANGTAADPPRFVGSQSCQSCHESETRAWSNSHHSWALRAPTPDNVLGDFDDATFEHKGLTSRFFRKDRRYFVETDGANGKLAAFEIKYVVGVAPLQQYLVETERGRLQALDIAWDVGAGRWFHLYPSEDVRAGNGLHWSGPYKNWQARCAECHQTGFMKNYDPVQHSYTTQWAELTVSCESCHGPASQHVAWARNRDFTAATTRPTGSVLNLSKAEQASELAICGPCHARREAFSPDSSPVGSVFGDHYGLALLGSGLYFPDGQQRDEVYILGSFLQSKMKAKGVTCSNCHEPHGGQLVAEGNSVCTQCHGEAVRDDFPTLKRAAYDTPAHHHHKPGSDAAQCVSCHMPERTYMGIDKRRDHFFRRPDPLQSNAARSPDVCTSCHTGETPEWAAQQISAWFPGSDRSWQNRSAFLAVADGVSALAELEALADYALDLDRPDIVRASAVDVLRDFADQNVVERVRALLADESDLVRTAAASLTRNLAVPLRVALLKPLLTDPVQAVRQAAAQELLADDISAMSAAEKAALDRALTEYRASRLAMADTPESQMAIAGAELVSRNWVAAETAFNEAIAMDLQLESAWLTLSRLRSALGDPQGAAGYLERGLVQLPGSINLMIEMAGQVAARGDDAAAIEWYRRVLAAHGSERRALAGLGFSALRVGDYNLAIEVTATLLSLDPANAQAYAVIAVSYYAKGDHDRAKENAAKAQEIDPFLPLPQELERLLQGE